jgi:hypothetical protein
MNVAPPSPERAGGVHTTAEDDRKQQHKAAAAAAAARASERRKHRSSRDKQQEEIRKKLNDKLADDKSEDKNISSGVGGQQQQQQQHQQQQQQPYIPSNKTRESRSLRKDKPTSRRPNKSTSSDSVPSPMDESTMSQQNQSSREESGLDDSSRPTGLDESTLSNSTGTSNAGERRPRRRRLREVVGEEGEHRKQEGAEEKIRDTPHRSTSRDDSSDDMGGKGDRRNSNKEAGGSRRRAPERVSSALARPNCSPKEEEDAAEIKRDRRAPGRTKSSTGDGLQRHTERTRSGSNDNISTANSRVSRAERLPAGMSREERAAALEQRLDRRRVGRRTGPEKPSRGSSSNASQSLRDNSSESISERRRRRKEQMGASAGMLDSSERIGKKFPITSPRRSGGLLGDHSDDAHYVASTPMADYSEPSHRRAQRKGADGAAISRANLRRNRTTEGVDSRRRGDNDDDEGEVGNESKLPNAIPEREVQKLPGLRRAFTEEPPTRSSPVRSMGRDRRASRRPTSLGVTCSSAQAWVNAVDSRSPTGALGGTPLYGSTTNDVESENEEDLHMHKSNLNSMGSLDNSASSLVDESERSEKKSRRLTKLLPKTLRKAFKGGSSKNNPNPADIPEDETETPYDLDD